MNEYMYLRDNKRTCSINSFPDDTFKINLGMCGLKYIPESIRGLNELEMLILSHNKIKNIPSFVGELPNLVYLHLTNNKLSKLPHTLALKKSNIGDLKLGNNNLSSLPESFKNLKKLGRLELQNNNFKKIPEVLIKNKYVNLEFLFLQGNSLRIDEYFKLIPMLENPHQPSEGLKVYVTRPDYLLKLLSKYTQSNNAQPSLGNASHDDVIILTRKDVETLEYIKEIYKQERNKAVNNALKDKASVYSQMHIRNFANMHLNYKNMTKKSVVSNAAEVNTNVVEEVKSLPRRSKRIIKKNINGGKKSKTKKRKQYKKSKRRTRKSNL